ncbi:MAG TPA: hypothetical protein DDX14_00215, partial [Cyanobacteria bacterium UBA9579]|nr:hypothetical protein [Cyanobacteria bacterium UBA9579]
GGQATANGVQNGLNNINQGLAPAAAVEKPALSVQDGIAKFNETKQPVWNKAECPVCKGKGCKYCSDAVPANQAQAPAAQGIQPAATNPIQAPQIAKLQMAQNPQLAGLVDQAQNPYQLSDTEIKNLLAAIMQLVNQSGK